MDSVVCHSLLANARLLARAGWLLPSALVLALVAGSASGKSPAQAASPRQLGGADAVLVSCPALFATIVENGLRATGARLVMASDKDSLAAARAAELRLIFLCDSSRVSDEVIEMRAEKKLPLVLITPVVSGRVQDDLQDISGAAELIMAPFDSNAVADAARKALNPPKLTPAEEKVAAAARAERQAERDRKVVILAMEADALLAMRPPVKDGDEALAVIEGRLRDAEPALSDAERDVMLFIRLRDNGLWYFVEREYGDRHSETAAALRRMGFSDAAAALEETFALLAKHGSIRTEEQRQKALLKCCTDTGAPASKQWHALIPRVDRPIRLADASAKLLSYLASHRAELKAVERP